MDFNQDILLLVENFNNQAAQLEIAVEVGMLAEKRYKTSIKTSMIGKIDTPDLNDAQSSKGDAKQKHIQELYYYWCYFYNIRSITLYDFLNNRILDADFEEIVRRQTDHMILIIDDDAAVRPSLIFLLKRAGFRPEAVPGPKEALEAVRTTAPELILMDMNFMLTTTGGEGTQLLRQVKISRPDVPVILMTAWGSISLAVQGMQVEASDSITKPRNNLVLLKLIRTALELSGQKKGVNAPLNRSDADHKFHSDKIVGQSAALMDVLETAPRIAPTNASVPATDESGTGKELIAEVIHANSPRSKGVLVKVNLGGPSQSLFESKMFGHKKGVFTDAYMDRVGCFEMANKGTIFLDKIGDLKLSCQVKLPQILQDQTFEVLGDSRPRKVDIRVVSTTNQDLRSMVADHMFREGPFYRTNLITVHLPALHERREDIPLLARYFTDKQLEINGLPRAEFSSNTQTYLGRLPFPGNIRELKSLVERTISVSGKTLLDAVDSEVHCADTPSSKSTIPPSLEGLTLDGLEKQTVSRSLEAYEGNLSHVTAALGISRAALYRRLEKHGTPIDE